MKDNYHWRGKTGEMNSGAIYEQAVVKTVAGFFRGSPTRLFGVTRLGARVVYVRASIERVTPTHFTNGS